MNCSDLTPDESYAAAQELAVAGRYVEAIDVYSLAIASDPGYVNAYCGRGLAFQRIGEHSKAIADLDVVISCFPDWPGAFAAYYSRAASLQALGENLEAIDDCNEAINRESRTHRRDLPAWGRRRPLAR